MVAPRVALGVECDACRAHNSHIAGFVLLMLLMLAVTFHDVWKLFT